MYRPTIASAVSTKRLHTITGTGIDQGGPLATLGAKAWLDGQRTDQGVLVVDSSGDLKGGPTAFLTTTATDVTVNIPANTGPWGLQYIHNASGGPLAQGTMVKWDAALGVGDVVANGAGDLALRVGILLFNIADDEDCWVVTEGVVPAKVAAACVDGQLLTTAASGELTPTGANDTNAVAVAAQVFGGAAIGQVRILPKAS